MPFPYQPITITEHTYHFFTQNKKLYKSQPFLHKLFSFTSFLFADNKSIVKDTDWKKLWQRAGQQKIPNLKVDNNIDSTDTSMIEDNEVNIVIFLFSFLFSAKLGNIELSIILLNKDNDALFILLYHDAI